MRSRLTVGVLGCAAAVTSCGAPAASTDQAESVATTSVAISTSVATSTSAAATTTSAVSIEEIRWLVPTDPSNLRLIDASRTLVPDCGLGDDCAQVVASATLSYETGDQTVRRSMRILETLSRAATYGPQEIDNAPERAAGDRRVRVIDDGFAELPSIRAAWTEPGGHELLVDSIGIPWDELAVIIGGLAPIDGADWPGAEIQTPDTGCVDARSQIAPTFLPEGWQRFVITAAPTGACGQPTYLMMSVVALGTLVTVVTAPAAMATPQPGEPVEVNGWSGTLRQSTMADGQPTASISIVIDTVAVEAHGNADVEQLKEIVASIRPFDDAEWADLVNAVGQPG